MSANESLHFYFYRIFRKFSFSKYFYFYCFVATSSRSLRGSLWGQPLLSVVQNHLISYPTPSNLSGNWNWGVLAGLCLVLQIATGIFLAMHYTAHVDLAFHSVQHIMRDVSNGWLLRYLHANGASLFFIVVYMHLFRGLYYTSYAQPRELVWLLGVVILLVMILTAFIGYVLPWGLLLAPNEFYFSELKLNWKLELSTQNSFRSLNNNLLIQLI